MRTRNALDVEAKATILRHARSGTDIVISLPIVKNIKSYINLQSIKNNYKLYFVYVSRITILHPSSYVLKHLQAFATLVLSM
nr:MAG TPA: hypothetical protein [Caudoviricetes sp.]